jgi:hypothetical protein
MIKQLISAVLLAAVTIFIIYWWSYKGDYASVNFSIVVTIFMALLVLAALISLIIYITTRQWNSFFTIYISVYLISTIIVICCFDQTERILNFLNSSIGKYNLIGINTILVIIAILLLWLSYSGHAGSKNSRDQHT